MPHLPKLTIGSGYQRSGSEAFRVPGPSFSILTTRRAARGGYTSYSGRGSAPHGTVSPVAFLLVAEGNAVVCATKEAISACHGDGQDGFSD
jgi:hypothetical protein